MSPTANPYHREAEWGRFYPIARWEFGPPIDAYRHREFKRRLIEHEASATGTVLWVGTPCTEWSSNRFSLPRWCVIDLHDPNTPLKGNGEDLPFRNETFVGVFCCAVLEHVRRPEQVIEEIRRVLKPGGWIWIEVPFCQPYHPGDARYHFGGDYWRVTIDGARLWFRRFALEVLGGWGEGGILISGRKP